MNKIIFWVITLSAAFFFVANYNAAQVFQDFSIAGRGVVYVLDETMTERIRTLLASIVLTVSLMIFFIIECIDALHNFSIRKLIRKDFSKALIPVPYIRALGFIIAIAFNLVAGFLPNLCFKIPSRGMGCFARDDSGFAFGNKSSADCHCSVFMWANYT